MKAGGRTQTQELQGGYGHSNVQNDLVLTFGLGAACDVDSIEVLWPNGQGHSTPSRRFFPRFARAAALIVGGIRIARNLRVGEPGSA